MRVRAIATVLFCTIASLAGPLFAQDRAASPDPQVPPLQQTVVVTASADPIPESQTGAPIAVIDAQTIEALHAPDVLDALRLVPGVTVAQTGGRGGPASLFIRGGNTNFNKVLIDGIAANDIGGAFDFAQISTAGVDRVEVLRQTNSVLYGTDALAGVVAITTPRGQTRTPDATLRLDGGNLGTLTTAASIGGIARRFDYFSEYAHDQTDNDLPNNAYRNGTYAGRFGVRLGTRTDLSGSLRRIDTTYGAPNAFDLYGIADDASQKNGQTYASIAAQSQITERWQTVVRFGTVDQTLHFVNPAPTGELVDGRYLGHTVTLRGANGASVTGRAILDFGGTYPSVFDSRTTRRVLSGDTTYVFGSALTIAGGARVEREQGFSNPDGTADVTRANGGAFAEARLAVAHRHFITAGLGVEHNAVFGNAATPRVSIASYLREPSSSGNDTRLVFNAGRGIKAPSVFQQQSSLFALVQGTSAAAGVTPIAPERSRSIDIGVEQAFAHGTGRVRVSYFHNTFDDLIEFLSKSTLPLVGVPPAVADATAFGAYVNSQSYRAQGVEASVEARPARALRVAASYTRLDAEVTRAFSADPSFNDAFPGVAIGAFSPLVGARPFRRPANSGTLLMTYAPGRAELAVSAYLAGRSDDSTFATDAFFGNSLLLPNRDLNAAYQKVDVGASYQVHAHVGAYVAIDNLFDERYEMSFGYPALPLTARAGIRVGLGGD